ncbi:MAG: hypothetical protein DRO88_06115 [Promethearchaeia archaeon]|nr:MAG: hypothetical protein DRO88_06115 [Candidatus Lokiarchaeia archaeon]
MDILLIDDDLQNQDQIKQFILQIDPTHEITTCHSSVDAQKHLRKKKFDLIISEVYLKGGLQGNELMYEVSNDDSFKVGMAELLLKPQIRIAFNEFLIKPITKKKIEDVLTKAKYNLTFLQKFQ